MNMASTGYSDSFFTTKKLVAALLMLGWLVVVILSLSDSYAPFKAWLVNIGLWLFVLFFVLRYIIFEERMYYKVYRTWKNNEFTTPAIFWNIASINDTPDGAIMTYADSKLGVMVRFERDTITGKNPDFRETHFDAFSNFYKEIVTKKYSFVQFSVMEKAGNDPRLDSLDSLVYKCDNDNLRSLIEKEVGYIKAITHNTLYESDCFLIYTKNLSRFDTIAADIHDIASRLLDGAYVGYRIMNTREVNSLVKELNGVRHFNYIQATLDMFKMNGDEMMNPLELKGIVYETGERIKLDKNEASQLLSIANDVNTGARNIKDIDLEDAVSGIKSKRKNKTSKIDISKVASGDDIDAYANRGQGTGAKTGGLTGGSKTGGLGVAANKQLSASAQQAKQKLSVAKNKLSNISSKLSNQQDDAEISENDFEFVSEDTEILGTTNSNTSDSSLAAAIDSDDFNPDEIYLDF